MTDTVKELIALGFPEDLELVWDEQSRDPHGDVSSYDVYISSEEENRYWVLDLAEGYGADPIPTQVVWELIDQCAHNYPTKIDKLSKDYLGLRDELYPSRYN